MIDKIKVNLSFFVYNTLLQDMIRFECFKPNGDINRNDFLNCVICNFYDNKIQKRERLQKQLSSEAILTDVSEKNKKKMLDAATKIMDDFYNEDLSYRSHPFSFMIYPTKRTQAFFDSLYENEIRSKDSLSSFIRRLLNEYVFLPPYVRESVVKRHEYVELYTALKNENVVLLSVSGREYRIAPFRLSMNEEETYNYLLGLDLESKEETPISIRLCKISDVTVSKEKHHFTKKQRDKLMEILANGIEFASGEILTVRIRASKGAQRMMEYRLHNRPNIHQKEKDVFEVTCSLSNFIHYFLPFGKEIQVLDHPEIRKRMLDFYEQAAESYRQSPSP